MNISSVLVLLSIFCLGACVSKPKHSVPGLEQFYGKYVGLSPTDESAIGMGEIALDVQESKIKISMATGHRVQEEEVETSELVPMTADEVKKEFKEGSIYPERILGFRSKDVHPEFLFLKDPAENEFGLVLRLGEMSEILGPTVLYSPAQIERGDYEEALKKIEEHAGKGVLPRLRNNGKAEK